MELIVMAAILAAVIIGQYYIYEKLGHRGLGYRLIIRRHGSDGITAGSGTIIEVFEDEKLEVIEEIDNSKRLPLPWVRTEISCSRWLSFYGVEKNSGGNEQKGFISGIFTLRPHQKCRRTWQVSCEKRGLFTIDDVSVTVSDLFGLVRSAEVIKLGQQLRVLPVPADIESGEASGDVFIGEVPVRRFVLPDPFMISGAREYTGREPMNRIHWPQSAKNGSLMVYSNEFTTERRVLILLNLQRSFHGINQKISVPTLEALIKGAAFMLDHCCRTNTEFSMTMNAPDSIPVETGEGYGFMMEQLRRLAEMKSVCGQHIDDFITQIDFTGFTDVIFISSFMDEKCADLFRGLVNNGRCVTVLSADIEESDFCPVLHIVRKKYSLLNGSEE